MPKYSRIVGVQGAVQLVSAIVALKARASELGATVSAEDVENHLIIHDLSTNDTQAAEFAEALEVMAKTCHHWTSIRFLKKAEINAIGRLSKSGNWKSSAEALCEVLAVERCDELLLGQNLLLLNHLLAIAFPHSCKFCYGDGIAINFSAEYYAPDAHPS
jgi:hypothetical protein